MEPLPQVGDDELYGELIEACKAAEKQLPGLSDWQGVLDEVTSANDGREELFTLALEYADSRPKEPPLNTADDFINSMNESRARAAAEEDMTPDELKEALQRSEPYAVRFAKLTRFGSLAVLSPRADSTIERDLAVAGLLTEMRRRTRLLMLSGSSEQGEREIVTYLKVLQLLDRNGCLRARLGVNGEVIRILIDLAQGVTRPLVASSAVRAELARLMETDAAGRKLAWLRDLKYRVSFYLEVSREQLLDHLGNTRRHRSEGLKRSIHEVKYDAELASAFDGTAPDVLSESDFDRAVEMMASYYHGVVVRLADLAWAEARLQAAWLGCRLRIAHDHESLSGRNDAVQKLAAEHPGTVARVSEDTVVAAVDPELKAAGWINREELIPVITIRLTNK